MTVIVVALLPVLVALAIYLVTTAWRPVRPRRRSIPADLRPRLLRAAIGAGVIGVSTRWPVGAIAAATLGWYLPEILGSRAESQADLGKTEGIAGWTELLRDTLLGPTGLEGAIESTAHLAPEAVRTPVVALAGRLRTQRPTQALASFADELNHPLGDHVTTTEVFAPGPDGRAIPSAGIPQAIRDALEEQGYDTSVHQPHAEWLG